MKDAKFFKRLGEECFENMIKTNPSGGIKEFVRIATEYGYKKHKEEMSNKGLFDENYLDSYQKLKDSLNVSVQIDHREVLKVVLRDLIRKRNAPSNKVVDSFDDVLRYYLSQEEFQRYVIDGEKLFEDD